MHESDINLHIELSLPQMLNDCFKSISSHGQQAYWTVLWVTRVFVSLWDVCDVHLFASFPPHLLDVWEFCRTATQAAPSVSPVQDSAVSEHLYIKQSQCTDTEKYTLKPHPLSFDYRWVLFSFYTSVSVPMPVFSTSLCRIQTCFTTKQSGEQDLYLRSLKLSKLPET